MRADKASSTAELVCGWRALGSLMPAGRRVLDDPFARGFVDPRRRLVLAMAERLPGWVLARLFRRTDWMLGGVMTFVIVRHRAIDDLLMTRQAPEPVVLLGAGYDTREARLARVLEGRTLYVVDHPATLERRRALSETAFGRRPRARAIEVEVDFARQSFAEQLLDAGLEPGGSAFWIWEGVSMYLEESAVRSTLGSIVELSAPGSLVAFDTWCPPAGGLPRFLAHELPSLAMGFFYSEPLRFAPRRGQLSDLLRDQGLKLLESTPGHELATRYLQGPGRRSRSSHMMLNIAEVAN